MSCNSSAFHVNLTWRSVVHVYSSIHKGILGCICCIYSIFAPIQPLAISPMQSLPYYNPLQQRENTTTSVVTTARRNEHRSRQQNWCHSPKLWAWILSFSPQQFSSYLWSYGTQVLSLDPGTGGAHILAIRYLICIEVKGTITEFSHHTNLSGDNS